jgi:hypothetical protein
MHIVTCELMTRDPIGHVSVHHLFERVFGGKNIAPPHGLCV